MNREFGYDHLASHLRAVWCLEPQLIRLEAWGSELARRFLHGKRLLVAGNGGSAAQAQHLTSELVGRCRAERQPLSAIALHAETSSLTAIGNDYGFCRAFARQVHAHGRQGDVLLVLSTSGRSENLIQAVKTARWLGLETWAMTGPSPNPLQHACGSSLSVAEADVQAVQEVHLVAIHLLCEALDRILAQVSVQTPEEAVGCVDVW
jgi:D-sedoheptulose 7-phosphate isomerase